MSRVDPARVEVASLSDVGRVRASNQDACDEARTAGGARLLVVADGMGGHAGGETASRLAVEAIRGALADAPDAASGDALRRAFEHANRVVHDAAAADPRLTGMGTTGVAACLAPDGRAHVANVGDSRAYRLRGERLEQITTDHSLVAELVRRGLLTPDEARLHPRRNEVLRSLGVDAEVAVDVHEVELAAGDVLLLCTDGLTGPVSDAEIAALLRRDEPAAAARALVELANRRGGPDNVTVQVARIPAPAQAPAASDAARTTRWLALGFAAALLGLASWRACA